MLPVSGLLNIYGPPKAGKTYAALDLAVAISDPGRETFFDWTVKTHGPVWYLQIDTPRGQFHVKYLEKMVNAGYNINGIHFADSLMAPYPFNILGEGLLWLQKAIQAAPEKPLALIVDTLRDAHGEDENDSKIMRNVVAAFVHALRPDQAQWVPPALILLTHEKKMGRDDEINLMSGSRGSNYLAGRMDCVMRVGKAEVRAESRTMDHTIRTGFVRVNGLWKKFNKKAEVMRYSVMDFPSQNARLDAFGAEWGIKRSTAQNYWKTAFLPEAEEEG